MTSPPRIVPGARVRHIVEAIEGVVESVARYGRLPTVIVRQDVGGTVERPMGEWERLPEVGSLAAT